MSLILEALRKSEAQRRLGQVPDLLSPMPGNGSGTRRWWRVSAYAAALVLVASAAWWLGQRNSATPIAAVPEMPVIEKPVALVLTPADAATEPTQAVPRARPTAMNATPSKGNAPTPVAAAKSTPPSERATVRSAPLSPPDSPQRNVALPSRAPSIPALPEPLPAPAATLQKLSDAVASTKIAPPLPSLADLSSAERQSLPPLRITMHVFAQQAAQRFAIIDGHRVGEGALLADGIAVAEITRDAVILDLRGRHLRLPRP